MTDAAVILESAVASLSILVGILIYLYFRERRHASIISKELDQRKRASFRMGQNQIKGGIAQALGTFSILTEYDELVTLSSTSSQGSLDMIGVKDDNIDLIEFKSAGARLTHNESKLKRAISRGIVRMRYRIVDIDIPIAVSVAEREISETQLSVKVEDESSKGNGDVISADSNSEDRK